MFASWIDLSYFVLRCELYSYCNTNQPTGAIDRMVDMAEQLIISISGVRGIVGKNLTADIASTYGCSFGTFLKDRITGNSGKLSVCIGQDSRPSGQMLKSAIVAGLSSLGIDVIDLGIVTTPGVSVMVKDLRCAGGMVVTASHNPAHYNGIKVLLDNGMAPPAQVAEKIRQYFFDRRFDSVGPVSCGQVTYNEQTDVTHIAKVLAIVDKEAIAAKKFNVVLDSVNGAGGRVTKKLLDELGCEIIAINDEPTGIFNHPPEPTAENIKGLCEIVKTRKADIGFAQDPDGDRLAIVDENGTYIGEEYTLALAAKYIFGKKTGKAATNLSTSRMIDDIAKKAGCQVIRTPVGEANVAAAMIENNCIIGGEGNGGVIDLRVSPVRDSLVGIALVLQLMVETGKSISWLVAEIGGYYMSKDKFAADKSQAQKILNLAKKTFSDAKLDIADGCRFDFADGWLHIRPSNTEPIVRVIAEATSEQAVRRYIDAVLKIIR